MSKFARSLSLQSALLASALGIAVGGLASVALADSAQSQELSAEIDILPTATKDSAWREVLKTTVEVEKCGPVHGSDEYLKTVERHRIAKAAIEAHGTPEFSYRDLMVEARSTARDIYTVAAQFGANQIGKLCGGEHIWQFVYGYRMPSVPTALTKQIVDDIDQFALDRGEVSHARDVCRATLTDDELAKASNFTRATVTHGFAKSGVRWPYPDDTEVYELAEEAFHESNQDIGEFCTGFKDRLASIEDHPVYQTGRTR